MDQVVEQDGQENGQQYVDQKQEEKELRVDEQEAKRGLGGDDDDDDEDAATEKADLQDDQQIGDGQY